MTQNLAGMLAALDGNLSQVLNSTNRTYGQLPGISNADHVAIMEAGSVTPLTTVATQNSPINIVADNSKRQELQPKSEWDKMWGFLDAPKNVVTNLLLNIGTTEQNLRRGTLGNIGGDILKAWTDNSFDMWNSGDTRNRIDIGTAFTFAAGQTTGLLGNTATFGLLNQVGNNADISKVVKDWGLGFTGTDYDVFSAKDRAATNGSNGINLGTILTQAANFAGDIAADPTTYIPFTKLGKLGVYAGRMMADPAVEKTVINTLVHVAEGKGIQEGVEAGLHQGTLDAVSKAVGESPEYIKSIFFKEVKDPIVDTAALVLSKMDNEQDMALGLLAMQHDSARAMGLLFDKYGTAASGEGAHAIAALDNLNGEGWLARQGFDKPIFSSKDFPAGSRQAEAAAGYENLLGAMYAEQHATNPIVKALWEVGTVRQGDATVARTGLSMIAPANPGVRASVDNITAKWRSYKVAESALGEAQHSVPIALGTRMWHIVTRPSSRHVQGIGLHTSFNVNEFGEIDKFASWLNTADRALSGKLIESGSHKNLLDTYRLATSPEQRAQAIQEAEQSILYMIAEKRGVPVEHIKSLATAMEQTRSYMKREITEKGYATLGNGDLISDPLLQRQATNELTVWNWSRIDRMLRNDEHTTIGWASDKAQNIAAAVRWLQGRWAGLVLLRPARLLREMVQNSVGVALSPESAGMLKRSLANGDFKTGLKYYFQNIKTVAKDAVDQYKIINGTKATAALLGSAHRDVQNRIAEADETFENAFGAHALAALNKPVAERTASDKRLLAMAEATLGAKAVYHTSGRGEISRLDFNRPLATYSNAASATAAKNGIGNIFSGTDDAAIANLRAAVKADHVIYQRMATGQWARLSKEDIVARLAKIGSKRGANRAKAQQTVFSGFEFRTHPKTVKPVMAEYSVYGDELSLSKFDTLPTSLREAIGVNSRAELKAYVESGAWRKDAKL
ncbi:MAG: hypothetical protein ACKO0Z_18285, partial [Betaproteobacteria bacterium]